MIDEENLQNVQELMQLDFAQLLTEFTELNLQVQDLLSEDEKIADQQNWVRPKLDSPRDFEKKTENWIAAVGDKKKGQKDNVDMEDDVSPHDSASQVSANKSESKKHDSDVESGSVSSSVSSACAREKSKRAALLARAASLKKKNNLKLKKCSSKQKWRNLK